MTSDGGDLEHDAAREFEDRERYFADSCPDCGMFHAHALGCPSRLEEAS